MALPVRLSSRAENLVVRLATSLPSDLQRALSGRRPAIDGLRAAPDIEILLALMRLAGQESATAGRGDVNPDRVRAETRAGIAALSRPGAGRGDAEPLRVAGAAGELDARLYRPEPGAATPPLLLYFHGGGWVIGDLETHDPVCRFLAATSGAAVLAVDYRLAPEHPFPAAVEDSLAAYRWLLEHAAELGCDRARIAVGGDSAGANMAAVLALLARDAELPLPALQVLLYPVTDAVGEHESRRLFGDGYLLSASDIAWFEAAYLQGANADEDPRASILRAPDLSGLSPAHVVTAGLDPLRDEGEEYARRLREAGVRTSLRRHPDLIHGFANLATVSPSAAAAMHELAGAIRMGLA